jgi:competence protein ComEA
MFSARKVPYQLAVLLIAITFALSGSAVASGKDKSKKKADETQQQASSTKLDLNTASDKDLDSLPGVGSATVKKIVAGRPYSSFDDLKRAGVSQSQIEKIRNLVTISSPGAASETTSASSGIALTKPSPSRSAESASSLPQSDNPSAAPQSGC